MVTPMLILARRLRRVSGWLLAAKPVTRMMTQNDACPHI